MNRKLSNFYKLWELSGADVEHKFTRANGWKTSYVEAGRGEPLLLLHGAGLGSVVWYQVIHELSKHYRVICPDKPGYGESDKPIASYDRKFYLDWFLDFTEKLSLDSFHLIGNSQGGAVSIAYAGERPKHLKSLILSNTAGISNRWSFAALGAIVGYHILPSPITGWNLGRYMIHRPKQLDREWLEYSNQVVREKGGRNPILIGMGRATAAFPTAMLQSIATPTLVVWGREEKLFPVWHAEKAAEAIPNAELSVIERAGHLPFLDQPERFIEETMGFLQKISATAS